MSTEPNIIMRKIINLSVCLLLFAGCSIVQPPVANDESVKPKIWSHFQAQLSMIESVHRWQVLLDWQANLKSGNARLTHAATGRIVELRWQGSHVQVRDNQEKNPRWKPIKEDTLMQYGIVLPPRSIAAILHHQIPKQLKAQGNHTWKGQLYGSTIRLRWQNNGYKLTMTDITHGRTAILHILR